MLPQEPKCKDLDARLVLVEEKIKHQKEVMLLMFENNAANQKLAAAEIARRLELLNGEASRLAQMQATYLPRELYDAEHKVVAENVSQNRRAALVAIISAIGGVILLLATWFHK